MASISREPGGRRVIQFVAGDGKRRSIRLGKVSQRTAEAVKVKVEHLIAASITGHALERETARWVVGLDFRLRNKLASVGLVPPAEPKPEPTPAVTLGVFLDGYIAARGDVKVSTATVYGHTRRVLIEHFGEHRRLDDVTPGDADEWRLGLVKAGLADNTVRRRTGIARQFFKAAVRKGLIASNPFDGLAASVRANTSRLYFVSREEADAVLEACPDAQWRLLFALSRFGGLRCPSEHLALRWADVNWERERLTIRSTKTEHHPDGGVRVIPLFPELLPYLREVFEEAEPGTEHVITRYRGTAVNLRTQLLRIIGRAGLKPWPKLWQNLRSTRETELAEQWPLHVVCGWLGNSQPVAAKHYLQVTDEHFEQAAAGVRVLGLGGEALQNPVQQPHAEERVAAHSEPPTLDEEAENTETHADAQVCIARTDTKLGDTGLEPVTSRV